MSNSPPNKPCESCPYRRGARTEFWHASEFINLLQHDAQAFAGQTFACHETRKKPESERHFCVGWLLDQRRRGYPSIQLRLRLGRPGVSEYVEALEAQDSGLYGSIHEMCRANGVEPAEHDPRMAFVELEGDTFICQECGGKGDSIEGIDHRYPCPAAGAIHAMSFERGCGVTERR